MYKNISDTFKHTLAGWIKEFMPFPNPKVNGIARLEFELSYFEVAVQYVNLYAAETLPGYTYDVFLYKIKSPYYFPKLSIYLSILVYSYLSRL